MLNVELKSNPNIYFANKVKRVMGSSNIQASQKNDISFKGNVDFILVNKIILPTNGNLELKHISNVLKTLGVKELEIGDNVELARLLKSAMYRVKMLGFDIPTIIRCESKIFNENEQLQASIKTFMQKHKNAISVSAPGVVGWDGINTPILYLNTGHNWKSGNGISTKSQDPRNAIWHETGHYLHMQNHKKNPQMYQYLTHIELDPYKKDIVQNTIGLYAAENPVHETIAEIFARLMSGEAYNKLHPEIFNIYTKYNGPMPKS